MQQLFMRNGLEVQPPKFRTKTFAIYYTLPLYSQSMQYVQNQISKRLCLAVNVKLTSLKIVYCTICFLGLIIYCSHYYYQSLMNILKNTPRTLPEFTRNSPRTRLQPHTPFQCRYGPHPHPAFFSTPADRCAGADFFQATVRCADHNHNNSCCPHIVRMRLQPRHINLT